VSILALATWCASGFRRSYRSEWERWFDRYPGTYEWVDILGLAAIVLPLAAIACAVWFLGRTPSAG